MKSQCRLRLIGIVLLWVMLTAGVLRSQDADVFPQIQALEYSPDGRYLAVGGGPQICGPDASQYAVHIIRVDTMQVSTRLVAQHCQVNAVSWDEDSTYLYSSSNQGNVILWNTADRTRSLLLGTISLESEGFDTFDVQARPGSTEFSVAFTGAVLTWSGIQDDLAESHVIQLRVSGFDWNGDGNRIVITGWRGGSSALEIWDSADDVDGRKVMSFPVRAPSNPVWSPDGTQIAFSSQRRIYVMDTASGRLMGVFHGQPEYIFDLAWHPVLPLIAIAGSDASVRVISMQSGEQIFGRRTSRYSWAHVYAVAWSPDGSTLAYGGRRTNMLTTIPSVIPLDEIIPTGLWSITASASPTRWPDRLRR